MLSDERIDFILESERMKWGAKWPPAYEIANAFARAIESAATAPLLERIAELERQLEEVKKDAERYQWIRTMAVAGRIRREIEDECLPAGWSYPHLDDAIDHAIRNLKQGVKE